MDFKLNKFIKLRRLGLYFSSDNLKTKTKFTRAAVSSIVFGLALGIIFIYLTGGDGFGFITSIFINSFDKTNDGYGLNDFSRTFMYFSVYLLMGLGISLGFKLGLFNMGGSGQAVLGMAFAVHLLYSTPDQKSSSYAVVVVLVFALSAMVISALAGVLKALLNVHEVVTTIMLNWIIWYCFRQMDSGTNFFDTSNPGTVDISVNGYNHWFDICGSPVAFGLIISIGAVLLTWVVLTFTTFGYKFKMIGKQPSVSKYAGINAKLYIIVTTGVQGILIGLGALVYYFQIVYRIEAKSDVVPTIGFDALTIPLVAFNNIFGMIPVAFLWAIIKSGMLGAIIDYENVSQEMGSLFFGLIVYGAAIYALFLKIKPYQWLKTYIAVHTQWKPKAKINELNNRIKIFKIYLKGFRVKPEVIESKESLKNAKENYLVVKSKENKEDKKIAKENYLKALRTYRFEYKESRNTFRNIIKQLRLEKHHVASEAFLEFDKNKKYYLYLKFKYAKRINLYEVLDVLTSGKNKKRDSINEENIRFKEEIKDLNLKLNPEPNSEKILTEISVCQKIHQNNLDDINKHFGDIFEDILSKEFDLLNLEKNKYKEAKVDVKNQFETIKQKYNDIYETNKSKYKQELKQVKQNLIQVKHNILKESGEDKSWNSYVKLALEIEKNQLKIADTDVYKTAANRSKEKVEVLNKYGFF